MESSGMLDSDGGGGNEGEYERLGDDGAET